MNEGQRQEEKTRLCPSCRMEISVLAVKCRYCGEEVSRPRQEARQLTVHDLGEVEADHCPVSNSVIDALESFRSQESMPKVEAPRRSIFQRRKAMQQNAASTAASAAAPGAPALDARSQDLASTSSFRTVSTRQPTASERAANVARTGAAVLAALLLLLALVQGGAWVHGYMNRDEVEAVGKNPAVAILENDGAPVAALEAAVDFHRAHPSPGSREVLHDARQYAAVHAAELLQGPVLNRDDLTAASQIVNKAYQLDPAPVFQGLKGEVASDVMAYSTLLSTTDLNASPPTAVFRIFTEEGKQTVEAAEGEDFADGRFRLQTVRQNEVLLVDLKRDGRPLKCTMLSGIIPR